MDYKPVIIGIIAGLAVGYLYAKNKNKDIKLFSAVVAIIGGILGYVYAKHQCNPIGVLTKLKVPSKVNTPASTTVIATTPKTEAKYYGGR
jgi:disulfide bond formation protein DsbB